MTGETNGAASDERSEDARGEQGRPSIKVEDKRHWAKGPSSPSENGEAEAPDVRPTIVEEYRKRTEAAEAKLLEYIAAYKRAQEEQDGFRARLARDVERRAEARFGALVAELLETADDLDLALSHVTGVVEAASLAEGVALARDRFLAALERSGVSRLVPDGAEFDPNVAEAVAVVDAPPGVEDGSVAETVRAGYALGERILRPARVVVARKR